MIQPKLVFQLIAGVMMVMITTIVISVQMIDRRNFASGTLHQDVIERWGAPIDQPAPSVRAVESGSVFKTLQPLGFDQQTVSVDAVMNYRRRGLVFFSGFDFAFRGHYRVVNPEAHNIDVVFVFPVNLERNKVLLSDLVFEVDGEAALIDLSANDNCLVWTGRMTEGEAIEVEIAYRGRGLDSLVYRPDPALPVRDFSFDFKIEGGADFDYPAGVVPAATPESEGDGVVLQWLFPALESGVPVGAILPSETSFDTLIATMVRRSWAGLLLFFVGVHMMAASRERSLPMIVGLLLNAAYAFFFVLLPYLAAYMNFYVSWVLALLIIGGLVHAALGRVLGPEVHPLVAGILLASLVVPTLAVILQGYTGLIYTLEILALLAAATWLATHSSFHLPIPGPAPPPMPPVPQTTDAGGGSS